VTDKTPCQQVRDLHARHLPYWRQVRDAMDEEELFLDGDRYEEDQGPYNKDRRSIQIRGQEISDTVRHIAAQSTVRPRNVETRPIDHDGDPDAGEIAASLVELELSNPWKGFEDEYEGAIISAREKRLGVVWMDYEPDYGQFGEIFYSFQDPRRFMWDEAYHPHHPLCGWLIREKRVPVDVAREQYGAPWLKSDRDSTGRTARADRPVSRGASNHGPQPGGLDDDKVTIWECWYKNDKSKKYRTKDYQVLKPSEQYMSCTDGCGERSDPMAGLPEFVPGGCPTCGGDMHRIDAKAVDETALKFERGKRMIAFAPNCPNPDGDDPLYDGAWPIPGARSFPALFITAYMKPGRPMGPSDTTLMWDQQIASDNLRTAAVQRVLEHRNYWKIPRAGLVDYRNQRFEFRDDQFNVMFTDNSKADMGPLDVQLINGTGLDPAFAQVFGITQQALTQYRGVADFGFTPESSKDIAASTVQQLTAQGEIPTEHFNRRKNRELGKWYGVVWDYIRATYTPQRLSRLNLDGIDILASLQADDLPNFDFVISDSEPFTGVEKQKADSAKTLIGMIQALPDMWDLLAELQGFSPSVIRKFQKRMDEIKAQQPTPGAGMPPGMDGGGAPGDQGQLPPEMAGVDSGPGMVPGLNSPNGAGMAQ
jgi:hypothetical protein